MGLTITTENIIMCIISFVRRIFGLRNYYLVLQRKASKKVQYGFVGNVELMHDPVKNYRRGADDL